jgi:hypothetical protein
MVEAGLQTKEMFQFLPEASGPLQKERQFTEEVTPLRFTTEAGPSISKGSLFHKDDSLSVPKHRALTSDARTFPSAGLCAQKSAACRPEKSLWPPDKRLHSQK